MVLDTKYYNILGVKTNADQKEIKTAFRKLSVLNHPDKYINEEEKRQATIRFQQINEANEILSDPEKRSKYDKFGQNPYQSSYKPPPYQQPENDLVNEVVTNVFETFLCFNLLFYPSFPFLVILLK